MFFRKILMFGLFVCLFSGGLMATKEPSNRIASITFAPLPLISSTLDMTVAVKLANFVALTIPGRVGYLWYPALIGLNSPTPIHGKIGLGAKFMFANKGLADSLFLEPRVTFDYVQIGGRVGGQTISLKAMAVTPLLMFGYDWFWDNGFTMGLGVGAGWGINVNGLPPARSIYSVLYDRNATAQDFAESWYRNDGFVWALDWRIGVAF